MGPISEKKKLERIAKIYVLSAIGGFVVGMLTVSALVESSVGIIFGSIIVVAGFVSWIFGFAIFAKSKGYSPAIGLLCFLGLIGLIIIVVLPDQWKLDAPPVQDPNSNYVRDPNRI